MMDEQNNGDVTLLILEHVKKTCHNNNQSLQT